MKQVYSRDGDHIGTFDGEYVYTLASQKIIWRIDEDEVYTNEVPCMYVGELLGDTATAIDGSVLFKLR